MKKILLATAVACLAAIPAFAKPAPDAPIAPATSSTAAVESEPATQVAFCGWFTMPNVQVRIRYFRGADGKLHVLPLADWPVGQNEYRCI